MKCQANNQPTKRHSNVKNNAGGWKNLLSKLMSMPLFTFFVPASRTIDPATKSRTEWMLSELRTPLYGMLLTAATLTMLFCTSPAAIADIPPSTVDQIVQAIYHIEGGAKTRYPYGIKSEPCTSVSSCRKICENTVRNNYKRWVKAGKPGDFLAFLANRYAPVEVHPLNRHWLPNLRRVLHKVEFGVRL